MLAYLCGLCCVLVIMETCVRTPPGGGLAQSVYSCTPPVRRGRRAGSLSYSFRQLDCDYCLRRDAGFLSHFHSDLRLEFEVFKKYCQTELPEGEGRSNRPSIIHTIFLGLYQVTRPLTSECAKLDKSMLKCIST